MNFFKGGRMGYLLLLQELAMLAVENHVSPEDRRRQRRIDLFCG